MKIISTYWVKHKENETHFDQCNNTHKLTKFIFTSLLIIVNLVKIISTNLLIHKKSNY